MAVTTTVPTLDELVERLIPRPGETLTHSYLKSLYAEVASGTRDPIKNPLPSNLQILAAQVMVIVFTHVEKNCVSKDNLESSY